MARGAANQENMQNAAAAEYQGQGRTAYQTAMPAIQAQIANPGFDPTTAAAIRRSGVDTANSAFDAAKFSAAQRAGATGNDAMYYASGDQLAQQKAAADSSAANKAEVEIGTQKLQSQQQAIQDASQLYNYANTAGDARANLGNQAMMSRPSTLQDIGAIEGMITGPFTGGANSAYAGAQKAISG